MIRSLFSIINSVLLFYPTAFALSTVYPQAPIQRVRQETQIAQIDDPEFRQRLQSFVKEITVKITTDRNKGSGILIAKQGNTYLVLTNAHVIQDGSTFTIQTHDGKTHIATLMSQKNLLPARGKLPKFPIDLSKKAIASVTPVTSYRE